MRFSLFIRKKGQTQSDLNGTLLCALDVSAADVNLLLSNGVDFTFSFMPFSLKP
jgi:hypothetical protein